MKTKYTVLEVSNSGSFAPPDPTKYPEDRLTFTNRHDVERQLDRWEDSHNRVGSDPAMASLFVYVGDIPALDLQTTAYPDFCVRRGPRGGVRWEVA